jgi:nucleolar protein 53
MGRKRVSKKSKRSWRKFSNVKDVEDHLEQLRSEERTGGIVAKKPNERLFFVDKDTPVEKVSKKSKRPLKCEMHLWPDPRFRSPLIDTAKVVKGKKKQSAKVKQALKSGMVTSRGLTDKSIQKPPTTRCQRPVADKDLWANEEQTSVPNNAIEDYYKEITKQKPVKVPNTFKFNTPLPHPAIEVPHPGASYNPTFEDHQSILTMATEVEVAKLKKNKKLDRKVAMPSLTATEREAVWIKEMQPIRKDSDSDSQSDGEIGYESSEETVVRMETVRADRRKTRKQRRKESEKRTQVLFLISCTADTTYNSHDRRS